ncbi:MAG: hypothetical protein Q8O19_07050, partial [Rectinemataceae bacterium]|nr:hypothetical protein [Rectinemataceae bacterium]
YIDRDYLEDYASYYARCFSDYGRKCHRLHFFSIGISDEALKSLILDGTGGLSENALQDAYLGFSIINPLPERFLGKTCLKTFQGEARRRYSSTRSYVVHLFGLELYVKSLAFQEQDSTVAACATSALWSAFHGSGILFQHPIPSPVEITKLATQYVIEGRSFPNDGLSLPQITHAVRAVGLEPLTIHLGNQASLIQTNIHAYLSAGLPALLLLTGDHSGHAVTVTGYSLGGTNISSPVGYPATFRLKASLVDKLYVHDDQTGPFARAELFNSKGELLPYTEISGCTFSYKWLIVPIYHKIRIECRDIQDATYGFHCALEYMFNIVPEIVSAIECAIDNIYWDIRLLPSVKVKEECSRSSALNSDEKFRCLTNELPRFVWVVTAHNCTNNKPLLGLLFDATDITGGRLLIHRINYTFDIIFALRILFDGNAKIPRALEQIRRWLRLSEDE